MFATCVPRYMLRGNMGLSKHGDPVFPRCCPWNQNLACVRMSGGEGTGPAIQVRGGGGVMGRLHGWEKGRPESMC